MVRLVKNILGNAMTTYIFIVNITYEIVIYHEMNSNIIIIMCTYSGTPRTSNRQNDITAFEGVSDLGTFYPTIEKMLWRFRKVSITTGPLLVQYSTVQYSKWHNSYVSYIFIWVKVRIEPLVSNQAVISAIYLIEIFIWTKSHCTGLELAGFYLPLSGPATEVPHTKSCCGKYASMKLFLFINSKCCSTLWNFFFIASILIVTLLNNLFLFT